MVHRALFVSLTALLLGASDVCAQRERVLGTFSGINAPPVTAGRRVAWSVGPTLYMWRNGVRHARTFGSYIGTRLALCDTPLGPGVLFDVTGPSDVGLWYAVPGTGTQITATRLSTTQAGDLYGDGFNAVYTTGGSIAVYPLNLRLGTGLPAGMTPHVTTPWVTWHTSRTATTSDVNRYLLPSGPTSTVASASQFPVTDEAGRAMYLFGGLTELNRGLFLDTVRLTQAGETSGQYSYGMHHGQAVFIRFDPTTAVSDVVLHENSNTRMLASSLRVDQFAWARNGMAGWLENAGGLRLYDGRDVHALNTLSGASGVSQSGPWLDRGWAVHTRASAPNVVDVILRESPLTGEQDTISSSAGGQVDFNLQVPSRAGDAYVLLASVSGTSPGFSLAGIPIPLNVDPVLQASLQLANSSVFQNSIGFLSGTGTGAARFAVPARTLSGLQGRYLSFAYLCISPSGTFTFASNPARVKIE